MRNPWLVWLSGFGAHLRIRGSQVGVLVGAQAWVSGWVPTWGHVRGSHAKAQIKSARTMPCQSSNTLVSPWKKILNRRQAGRFHYTTFIKRCHLSLRQAHLRETRWTKVAADPMRSVQGLNICSVEGLFKCPLWLSFADFQVQLSS